MQYVGDGWHVADATSAPTHGPLHDRIAAECDRLCMLLQDKNAAYGNSAIDPLRVFSSSDPVEQLRVRIDDKLSRIARGHNAGEDALLDLIGYLILLRIAERGRSE